MKRGPSPADRWLMPWLAPAVLSALYLMELWREGATAEPAGLLVQVVLAAPLVLATSVLLAVLEQEARAHALTPRLRRWLVWTPRVLLLGFVAFLALLSLDVFVAGRGAGEVALGLLLHNVPALALLGVALLAWRWPWVGALGLAAFAAWWLPVFSGRGFAPSVVLLMAVLPLTVSALFLLSWALRDRGHRPVAPGHLASAGAPRPALNPTGGSTGGSP
jgi:hypothetical protein